MKETNAGISICVQQGSKIRVYASHSHQANTRRENKAFKSYKSSSVSTDVIITIRRPGQHKVNVSSVAWLLMLDSNTECKTDLLKRKVHSASFTFPFPFHSVFFPIFYHVYDSYYIRISIHMWSTSPTAFKG